MRRELYGETFNQTALLSLLPANWEVADLGCGTGFTAAALAPHVKRVVGVDQSAAMLRAARKRTASFANVELRQGSLEALPLDDDSVDGVLLILALTYVSDPRRALREASRILRAKGQVVVIDLLHHDRQHFQQQMGQANLGFAPQTLAEMLREAGLGGGVVRTLTPEPEAKGPALLHATGMKGGRAVTLDTEPKKRKGKK
jgi:ArsR family transcriptional regulator